MITVMINIPENSCLLIWKGDEPELLMQGRSTLQVRHRVTGSQHKTPPPADYFLNPNIVNYIPGYKTIF